MAESRRISRGSNRKLFLHGNGGKYINFEDLLQMIELGIDFQIHQKPYGDITKGILIRLLMKLQESSLQKESIEFIRGEILDSIKEV